MGLGGGQRSLVADDDGILAQAAKHLLAPFHVTGQALPHPGRLPTEGPAPVTLGADVDLVDRPSIKAMDLDAPDHYHGGFVVQLDVQES